MKIDWNRKYTTISVYTILTAIALMLIISLFLNFTSVRLFIADINAVLTPFYIGLIIAYITNPIMKMCEKRIFRFAVTSSKRLKAKRALSLLLAFIILLIIITILFLLIIPQITLSLSDLSSKMSGYVKTTLAWLDTYLPDSLFNIADLSIETLLNNISSFFENSELGAQLSVISAQFDKLPTNLDSILSTSFSVLKDYVPKLLGAVTGAANGLLNFVLGIFFSIYILSSKEKLVAQTKKLLRAISSEKIYNSILELANFSNKTFSGFFIGKIIDSIIVAIIVFVVFTIVKMPYAVLLSTMIGIANIIPVIGPFIGAIPGVLIIFIVDPRQVLLFIIINIVVQQIDGNVIGPKVLGETTGLASLWVLFAITVMGGLWGLFGMLIGVPLFAIIYMIIKLFAEKQLVSKNLSCETGDYYSENEIREFTENQENHLSFASRLKSHSENIMGSALMRLFKRKKKEVKPDSDGTDTEQDTDKKDGTEGIN